MNSDDKWATAGYHLDGRLESYLAFSNHHFHKRDTVPETIKNWNKNYEHIETSCREKYRCTPCTYPNCQRQVRLSKTAVKAFGKG
jgi:hypothetical protein